MRRFIILLICGVAVLAQQRPPSPVGYAEARQHRVEGRLTLPGTVESNVVSLVASEIGGLVVEYPVQQGDRVRKGQLLARLNKHDRELDLAAAGAQLKEAEAREKLAQRNYERAKDLFDSKVFSQQQLDDTLYEHNAWRSHLDNLRAEMNRIRYDIERSEIRAPFDGVVLEKRTELGEWLGVGDPVVQLLSLNDLEIRVDVPEKYFPALKAGGRAVVRFDAHPGRSYAGRVSTVIPRADEESLTFPVKIRLAKVSGLGVGMLADVRLDEINRGAGSGRAATIVPKDAIVRQGQRLLVWTLDGAGQVRAAPVHTGAGVGEWITVEGAVTPGTKVIVRGNERLRPGQKVRGEPVEYLAP